MRIRVCMRQLICGTFACTCNANISYASLHIDIEIYVGDLDSASHIPAGYENEIWTPFWESDNDRPHSEINCLPDAGSSGACNNAFIGCYDDLGNCSLNTGQVRNSIVNSDFECGETVGRCVVDCTFDACSVQIIHILLFQLCLYYISFVLSRICG